MIFGQVKAENENIIVPKEIFKEIRTELNNYESLKKTVIQKDLEIKQLEFRISKLDSIEITAKLKLDLLNKKVAELEPTFLDMFVKNYGFVLGLIVGVFISK